MRHVDSPRKFLILKRFLVSLGLVVLTGFLIPERFVVPVEGAAPSDWNAASFWFEPWGASGTHKGIDIFAPIGRTVRSSTAGIVLLSGNVNTGGNIVVVLGPKWRLHYYAHLDSTSVGGGNLVAPGDMIGTAGDTGNARGKQPHLHYVILSMIPYPWHFDTGTQGWKRMFYLDPAPKLLAASGS